MGTCSAMTGEKDPCSVCSAASRDCKPGLEGQARWPRPRGSPDASEMRRDAREEAGRPFAQCVPLCSAPPRRPSRPTPHPREAWNTAKPEPLPTATRFTAVPTARGGQTEGVRVPLSERKGGSTAAPTTPQMGCAARGPDHPSRHGGQGLPSRSGLSGETSCA